MQNFKITHKITQIDSNSLGKYFRDISKQRLLSQIKEVELVKRTREGDRYAKDELIKGNLRFVVSIAKQYQNKGVPLEDLINEGNIGLIKAAERFDETRGFKFISYAVWWIRQAILSALDEQSRTIRVPANKILTMSKIRKAEDAWMKVNGRLPSHAELAEAMGLTEGEISETIGSFGAENSIDSPMSHSQDLDIKDLVADPDSDDKQKDAFSIEQLKSSISLILSKLDPSERNILELFFGIRHSNQMSLDEISSALNISRERVRQIKERALRKLKFRSVRKQIQTLISN